MSKPVKRAAKNAQGDFFVRQDHCIACHICTEVAPTLMAYDREHLSCYFKEQPYFEDEIERTLDAYASCCMGAVDYEGNNPEILKRIAEIDEKYNNR